MIIDFIIEDLMLNSYLQKNFHTLEKCLDTAKTGVPHDKISEIIYCHTSSNLTPFQDSEVNRRLRNATSRMNTAFFCYEKQITPHWIWYNRVD